MSPIDPTSTGSTVAVDDDDEYGRMSLTTNGHHSAYHRRRTTTATTSTTTTYNSTTNTNTNKIASTYPKFAASTMMLTTGNYSDRDYEYYCDQEQQQQGGCNNLDQAEMGTTTSTQTKNHANGVCSTSSYNKSSSRSQLQRLQQQQQNWNGRQHGTSSTSSPRRQRLRNGMYNSHHHQRNNDLTLFDLYLYCQQWLHQQSYIQLGLYLVYTILLIVSTAFCIHRMVSYRATHRTWINAPITYIHRKCPSVSYQTLMTPADSTITARTDHNNKLKICITTLTDQQSPSYLQRLLRWRNFDGILALTWSNKLSYAKKYGYHLYDGSNVIDHSRPPAWSKIKAVKYLLQNEQCDWVMWTDADTIIMNSNIRIETFLPQDTTKDLIVAPDKGGGFNSGVFLFRNTPWSIETLDQWWNMTKFVKPHGMSLSGDNNAMKALLRDMTDFDQHVLSPPRCTFNSFAKFLTLKQSKIAIDHLADQSWYLDDEHYHQGDFIAHTPGVDNKIACLRLLLPEAT